jgi:ABC-type glycerol-3-phosphate transport system substrate-binding protein
LKKIKKALALPFALLLAVALTGCSGNKSSQGTKGVLYWWRIIGDAREETYEEIARNYSASRNVEIKIISKRPETYEEEVLSALAAHQSVENAPDIISLPSEDLPRFVPQLTPAPDNLFDIDVTKKKQTGLSATEYVKDKFVPLVSKTAILNNAAGEAKLYGLPITVDSLALYVNQNMLSEIASEIQANSRYAKDKSKEEITELTKKVQSAPKTWAELAEIVPYITVKDGQTVTRSAIAMGTSKNTERSYDILSTIMMQNGTQLTNASLDTPVFNQSQIGVTSKNNPGEEALKFYLRFSNPNDSLYSWNEQMPNSVDAFMQGQVAMISHYASLYVHLINEVPSMKKSIAVAPMPQISTGESAVGAQEQAVAGRATVFAVPSAKGDSDRQAAAWQFVRYLASEQGSQTYISATKMPSALKEVNKAKFDIFDEQKLIADTWYKGHKAMQVDEIFIEMIDDAYTGKKSITDCLNTASSNTATILQASNSKWSNK